MIKLKNSFLFILFSKFEWLLLLIFLANFIIFVSLIIDQRLVLHDTFIRTYMQGFILNNAMLYGELPQWIPYMGYGTSAFYWYGISQLGGLFMKTLWLLAPFLPKINLLPLSYIDYFIDELVLLIGTWALSHYLYKNRCAAFLVTAAVISSSIWVTQIYFNFYTFFAIPLILYLFHRFFDSRQNRYLFLALNLFQIQCTASAAYYIPIVSLVIFVYIAIYLYQNRMLIKNFITNISKMRFFLSIALNLILAAPIIFILKEGVSDNIIQTATHRKNQGAVPIDIFLTYASQGGFVKWLELFSGISWQRDFTLYIGLFPCLLVLVYCLSRSKHKQSYPFLGVCTLFYLFAMPSLISIVTYYCWPLMKFFRHISYTAVIVKLFLCFLAGSGFLIFFKFFRKNPAASQKLKLITLISMLMINLFLLIIANDNSLAKYIATNSKLVISAENNTPLNKQNEQTILDFQEIFLEAASKIFPLILLMIFYSYTPRKSYRKFILTMLFLICIIDLFSYKLNEFHKRTIPLSESEYKTFEPQPMPFLEKRSSSPIPDNDRKAVLSNELLRRSETLWTINAFLLHETKDSFFRTDYLEKTTYELLKAYKQDFKKLGEFKLTPNLSLEKFVGLTENKIQFFENAYRYAGDHEVISLMQSPEYSGNTLLISSQLERSKELKASTEITNHILNKNDRIQLSYEVTRFESNHIEINLNNPRQDPIWLMYSDAYHPLWKATTNKIPIEIFKANLGFKAIQIPPGDNLIQFDFYSKLFQYLHTIICLNGAFWTILILIWCLKLLKKELI